MSSHPIETTLDQLKQGAQGVIVRLTCERVFRRRLLDMGLVTGETITLKSVAPLGDPLELFVKGYQLSLRKCDARYIVVKVGDDTTT